MRDIALAAACILGTMFSVLMLLQSTLYASAICFLVVLMQVAWVFYALGVPLLAFLQVLIYAGAIMVLVVLSIMAAPPKLKHLEAKFTLPRPVLAVAFILAALELSSVAGFGTAETAALPPWPTLQTDLAAALFGRFAPFTELIALLVFVAALAVVQTRLREKR